MRLARLRRQEETVNHIAPAAPTRMQAVAA
jgi:hypothetical protein